MSRHQVSNDRYTFAFGVDHTCGPFVQIWDDDWPDGREYEIPLVDIDKPFGIRIQSPDQVAKNNRLQRILIDLEASYQASQKRSDSKPHLGEEHVIAIAIALGFSGPALKRKIRELWD